MPNRAKRAVAHSLVPGHFALFPAVFCSLSHIAAPSILSYPTPPQVPSRSHHSVAHKSCCPTPRVRSTYTLSLSLSLSSPLLPLTLAKDPGANKLVAARPLTGTSLYTGHPQVTFQQRMGCWLEGRYTKSIAHRLAPQGCDDKDNTAFYCL